MARQGFSFLTADDIRVVRLTPEGSEPPIDPETGDLQEVLPNGQEVGEIVFRGNIIMKGYWKKEEATREAFAGGWFHSGDLGVRYPDGTFAIADRAKDESFCACDQASACPDLTSSVESTSRDFRRRKHQQSRRRERALRARRRARVRRRRSSTREGALVLPRRVVHELTSRLCSGASDRMLSSSSSPAQNGTASMPSSRRSSRRSGGRS